MSADLDSSAREILRSLPNPFDDLVRPQYADGRFHEVHVPEVLHEPRDLLLKAIDAYRLQKYTSLDSLPPSRIITVIGSRGAGKTHLLESLIHRQDGKPQLIVCRRTENYEEDTPLEEYLFQLLIQALLEPHPVRGYRLFDALATHLTRKILLQTLRSLTPTERLLTVPLTRLEKLRLLWWGGGEDIVERFTSLADDLENPASGDLRQLLERHQMAPDQLERLAFAYLVRLEKGEDILSVIRRELYAAMLRAAMLGDVDALNEFLEADYRPAHTQGIYRPDVVRHLLHVLVEACALARLPVVFAFDNLVGLLAPSGQLDRARGAAFLDGLAQVVDHVRGFLLLLFAEQGLFLEMRKQAGTFARSRLEPGVALPGRPTLSRIELLSPQPEEIHHLITGRMRAIRSQLPEGNTLPTIFPFSSDYLTRIGSLRDQTIRGTLEGLRDEYVRIVFGEARVPEDQQGKKDDAGRDGGAERQDRALMFGRRWKDCLSEAARLLNVSLSGYSQALPQGLADLLQAACPLPGVLKAHPVIAVGDDPRYGHAVLMEVVSSSSPRPLRMAVGFLLASRRGMANDLQAKLAVFSDEKAQADHLRVLWATPKKASDLATLLPPLTRQVWQDSGHTQQTSFRPVEQTDLRKILAFPMWRKAVQQEDSNISREDIRRFVHEHCASTLKLAEIPNLGETDDGNGRSTSA